MKALVMFLTLMLVVFPSIAADTAADKPVDYKQENIMMHEKMMVAHQQAAECLKSGKTEEECRTAFQGMCKEVGGMEKCGPWMMHQKRSKKMMK